MFDLNIIRVYCNQSKESFTSSKSPAGNLDICFSKAEHAFFEGGSSAVPESFWSLSMRDRSSTFALKGAAIFSNTHQSYTKTWSTKKFPGKWDHAHKVHWSCFMGWKKINGLPLGQCIETILSKLRGPIFFGGKIHGQTIDFYVAAQYQDQWCFWRCIPKSTDFWNILGQWSSYLTSPFFNGLVYIEMSTMFGHTHSLGQLSKTYALL